MYGVVTTKYYQHNAYIHLKVQLGSVIYTLNTCLLVWLAGWQIMKMFRAGAGW